MNLEINKIAAAVLLGGVIAMTSGTIAKMAFGGYSHEGGEGEEKRGFKVEGAEVSGGGAEEQKPVDIGTYLAAATAEQGADVTKKCLACHDFSKGGPNKVGPNLWGVLGGPHAHKGDFQYSAGMEALKGDIWTPEKIWAFINNPAATVKGTKMSFAGLKKPEEIAAAIKYLNTMTDKPVALPAPKPAGADDKKAGAKAAAPAKK